MAGIFGTSTSAKQPTAAGSLQLQSAQRGGVIPLVYGTTRVSPNVIDYDDFHTTMVPASSAGKGNKGGAVGAVTGKNGKNQATVTEYIASFILGVCQGPITGTGQAWFDKFITTVVELGYVSSINYGADGQAPDPYWSSAHPSKALSYSGTMNVVFANRNLGLSSTMPNFSLEIMAILSNSGINGLDADPSQIILDFLTNPRYGAGFPLANWWPTNTDQANPTSYASYVRAVGLWLSYSMETQQQAQQYLDTITKLTNSEVVWSGGLLKIIPRGDTQVIGRVTSNSSWTITLNGGDASGTDTITVTISDPVLGTSTTTSQTIAGEHLPDIGNNLVSALFGIISHFNIVITNVVSAQTPLSPPPAPQNNTAVVTIEMIQGPARGTTTVSISGPSIDFTVSVSTTSAGGVGTFTPNNVPIYALGEDDFIAQESTAGSMWGPNPGGAALRAGATPVTGGFVDDPVHITRSSPADAYNVIKLECLDRGAWYNSTIVEASDQAAIDAYGYREQGSINARAIVDPGYVGYTVAQLLLQRSLLYRNTYTFQLGWKYVLLEPMDIVQITDARLGASAITVRITAVEEDNEGMLSFTAEDYFGAYSSIVQYPPAIPPSETAIFLPAVSPTILGGGAGVAPLRAPQLNGGEASNFDLTPGNVNPPFIFEPPPPLVTTSPGYEIWIALSSASSGWGGANVYVSTDNNSYAFLGQITGAAAMGQTTASFPVYSGADPDTVDTLSVDLTESNGSLVTSATPLNASQGVTLCWLNGEILSYELAALTGPNKYNITRIYRGIFGSTILGQNAGAPFTGIGPSVGRFPYPSNFVGQLLYFKFASFNIAFGGVQSIANLPAYTFTPLGTSHSTPVSVSGSSQGKPASGAAQQSYVFSVTTFFPFNFAGSQSAAGTAATSTATYTIQKNFITCGHMIFAAAALSASFTTISLIGVTFDPGDVLTLFAPNPQDATLANVAWTFVGTQPG